MPNPHTETYVCVKHGLELDSCDWTGSRAWLIWNPIYAERVMSKRRFVGFDKSYTRLSCRLVELYIDLRAVKIN